MIEKVICLVYVYFFIFLNPRDINEMIKKIQKSGLKLNVKDGVDRLLGVSINWLKKELLS